MMSAGEDGHDEMVKHWLANDIYGVTPIGFAAAYGQETVAKLLLATERVDPIFKDPDRESAPSFAAAYGHQAVVKLLLATEGVDAHSPDCNGATPLLWAAANGRDTIVKLLLAVESTRILTASLRRYLLLQRMGMKQWSSYCSPRRA